MTLLEKNRKLKELLEARKNVNNNSRKPLIIEKIEIVDEIPLLIKQCLKESA